VAYTPANKRIGNQSMRQKGIKNAHLKKGCWHHDTILFLNHGTKALVVS
jgi:hypothetical protein